MGNNAKFDIAVWQIIVEVYKSKSCYQKKTYVII